MSGVRQVTRIADARHLDERFRIDDCVFGRCAKNVTGRTSAQPYPYFREKLTQRDNPALVIAGALFLLMSFVPPASSQTTPSIRIVVGSAAGGGPDVVVRFLAVRFANVLGRQVLIDNRPGANGAIAAEIVARSAPDGSTWLLATGQHTTNPSLQKNLTYDVVNDFAPVSVLVTSPYVLVVHPSIPAKSVSEFVTLARMRPGKLNFGSGGIGSSAHLAAELFRSTARINVTHVPYKGAALAVNDVMGGHLEFMFPAIASVQRHIQSSRLRGLAVTSSQRYETLSDMPTISEAGFPGFEFGSWVGILLPTGTAKQVVDRIHEVIVRVVNHRESREALIAQGTNPATSSSPEEFSQFIRAEVGRFSRLLKALGIQAE